MHKTAQLVLTVQYDDGATDPDGLCSAFDTLIETAMSTPGIMDEYGNPSSQGFVLQTSGPSQFRSYPFRTLDLKSEAAGNRLRQILADIPTFTGLSVLNTGNVTGMWCPSPGQALHSKPVISDLLTAFEFGVPWSSCKFLFHLPNVRTTLDFKFVENRWVVAITESQVSDV